MGYQDVTIFTSWDGKKFIFIEPLNSSSNNYCYLVLLFAYLACVSIIIICLFSVQFSIPNILLILYSLHSGLFVDAWKLDIIEDTETGQIGQHESFVGQEKMIMKEEQVYLGDMIAADGKHLTNVRARKNKGLGAIDQIMQILETV